MRCHAGCRTGDVLAALELSMADLFPDRPGGARADVLAEYDYLDADGQLAFQVVRLAPKSFRQRRPDGAGGWEWNLHGVERVLYRLPAVLEAARRGEGVFVVEGEKDVEALEREGVIATTSPGGAGKWRPAYAEALRGAEVVVIADRDEPGRKHAREVAASLEGIAASVEVVEPAEGRDASDHLAAGRKLAELVPVEQSSREDADDGARAVPFSAIEREEVKWLWPGRVPLGMLSLLVGDPGLGKSLLTCDLAARTSRAGAAVVMISAEDSKGATVRPRLEAANAEMERVFAFEIRREGIEEGLSLPDDVPQLEQVIAEHEVRLVVLDPLMAFLPEKVNSWRDQSVRRALAPLHRLAERYGCAALVVAHLNKDRGASPLHRTGGSIGVPAAVRSALLLARDPEDPEGDSGRRRVLAHHKCNVAPQAPSLACEVEEIVLSGDERLVAPRITISGESSIGATELLAASNRPEERSELDEAIEFLRLELAGGPRATKQITRSAKEAGISEVTLKRARKKAGVEAFKDSFGGGWMLRYEGDHPPGGPSPPGDDDPLRRNPLVERDSGPSDTPSELEGDHVSEMIPFGGNGRNGGDPMRLLSEDELVDQLKRDFGARELERPRVGQLWFAPNAPRERFEVLEVDGDTARIRHELGGIALDWPLAEFDGSVLRRLEA